MAKMEMAGKSCSCGHHKWAKGLIILLTGGVLWYTGSWAYAIMAFGALLLVGGFCKCCNNGSCCC